MVLATGCGSTEPPPPEPLPVVQTPPPGHQRKKDLDALRGDKADLLAEEALRSQLMMLRAACELYVAQENDRYPDFSTFGWQQLIDGYYLVDKPLNPLSPEPVAGKLIVVSEPGLRGSDLDPKEAGWVWNESEDFGGMLFAAGIDE